MNPTLLDIVEAYRESEATKQAVIKKEKELKAAREASLKQAAKAKLDEIFAELQPAIDRTRSNPGSSRRPLHALVPHCHDSNTRNFWSLDDHGMSLLASAVFDGDKFTFQGACPPPKPFYMPRILIEPIVTHDETEFRVWLAKFLGIYIATHCS